MADPSGRSLANDSHVNVNGLKAMDRFHKKERSVFHVKRPQCSHCTDGRAEVFMPRTPLIARVGMVNPVRIAAERRVHSSWATPTKSLPTRSADETASGLLHQRSPLESWILDTVAPTGNGSDQRAPATFHVKHSPSAAGPS